MSLVDASLRQLEYLRAVASERSFADAADAVGVSQSALSQGLARLEALAGVRLLQRDGRRKRLTRAGRVLLALADRVLGDVTVTVQRIEAVAAGRAGLLRVALIDAAALYLFSRSIETFRNENPDIELRLSVRPSEACLAALRDDQADVAVVVGPAPGFVIRDLASEPLYLYGPSPDPGPDSAWLLYPAGSHTRSTIEAALAARGIVARVSGESGNPAVLYELAVLMQGWTVVPRAVHAGARARLVEVGPITHRPIVAAMRPDAPDPLVDRFIEAVQATGAGSD